MKIFYRKIFCEVLSFICVGLFAGSLALANVLTVDVNNKQPILVPTGNGTFVNGRAIHPPYFVLGEISVNWNGETIFAVSAVHLYSLDSKLATFDCVVMAHDLNDLFSFQGPGPVVLQNGLYKTTAIGCGDLEIPSPLASSFDIPVSVDVTGVAGLGGQPHTYTSSAIIHIQ